MKIAISGKGGAGKTTVAGNLARAIARRGRTVLAVDADPNPNLAATLGLGSADPAHYLSHSLVEEATAPDGRHVERLKVKGTALLDEYGLRGPDATWLVTVGTVEHADTGCNCSFHSIVRGLLTDLAEQPGWISVTDMEAGLEHLKRGTVRSVDALLVLIEPYYRSLETGRRVQVLAQELGVPRVYAVANKVRDEADEAALAGYCQRHGLELIGTIPYDEVFQAADRSGASASDLAPESASAPGLAAIDELAGTLEARLAR